MITIIKIITCYPGNQKVIGSATISYIRSLSKFKKALDSSQKSTLILKKRWHSPVKKHPILYKNTDIRWTGTHILTFDVIIICLFSGSSSSSRLGSPVTLGVTQRQSRVYIVDCKGIFTPHTSYLGIRKYASFTKSQTCGGLKKDPLLLRNT